MRFRLLGLFAAVALVIGGAGAFVTMRDSGGAADGPGKALKVALNPEQPLLGEEVTISGKVAPAGRQVVLERGGAGAWERVETATTAADKTYSFTISAGRDAVTYRVSAPASTDDEEDRRARLSPELQIVSVAARGVLELRPPIGQSEDRGRETVPAVASFVPAREDAPVEIQRAEGGAWKTMTSGEQDEDGRFAFVVPAPGSGQRPKYRAITEFTSEDGKAERVVTAAAAASPWKLSWGDDFDGSKLAEHWTMIRTGAYAGRGCARVTPETAVVKDGIGRFFAMKDPAPDRAKNCPGGQYLNAQYGTLKSPKFTYGVFAARIKAQEAVGMHSAFWLYPDGKDPKVAELPVGDLAGRQGTEIDIMEYFGDEFSSGAKEGKTWSYVYRPEAGADGKVTNIKDGGPQLGEGVFDSGNVPSDGYHVYSVEWTPEHYIFRIDGIETSRVQKGISRRQQTLRLSMLTSDWEIPDLLPGSLPASMEVDWVRVWQR